VIAAVYDRYTITGTTILPVTSNDLVIDGCGEGLTVELLGQPSNGTIELVGVDVEFTPTDERLCTVGSFTYRLNSPCGMSNIALVIVEHQPATIIWGNDNQTIILSDGTCLVDN